MKIFEKIKVFIQLSDLTQKELGEMSGKSQQTITNYLTGQNQIPLDWLVWFLNEFPEIDIKELFNEKSDSYKVSEPRSKYGNKRINKESIINRISQILDEEL